MKRSIFAGKRIEGVLTACLLFVFLTGCGSKEVQLQAGTNLQVSKDGSVLVTYMEEFPSDYYDISELEAMNQEEVDAYNRKNGANVVEVIRTETDGNRLTLSMRYEDMSDYADMNGIQAYNGTVSQAKALGYDFNRDFYDVKNGGIAADIDWEDLEGYHVVVTNEPSNVHTYKNIVYVSESVTVSKDRKMATVAEEEQAVIVFK